MMICSSSNIHLLALINNMNKYFIQEKEKPEVFNLVAIELFHDPRDFSEKLLTQLEISEEYFEVNIMMNFGE